MGACMSSENADEVEQKKRSRAIDAALEEDARRLRKECKILLLGTLLLAPFLMPSDVYSGSGESGKSTIVKQMKIIHQNGYTVEELALYRLTIYKNVLDCAKSLIAAMDQFEVKPKDDQVIQYCNYLMDYQVDPDPQKTLEHEVAEAIITICHDASYGEVMEHQSEFYLMDSAP